MHIVGAMRARAFLFLLALPGLAPGGGGDGPRPTPEAPAARILLTGFQPFGGRARNVSWDAIKPLDGVRIDDIEIRCLELPVEWGKTKEPLAAAIRAFSPRAVISFGEGRPGRFSVETRAQNAVAAYPDNAGAPPGRDIVLAGAPAAYATRLPTEAIRKALAEAGHAVEISREAGRYLCEECFFTLMHLTAARPEMPCGFVHVPPYPPQATPEEIERHAARVREAVLAIVKTTLRRPAGEEDGARDAAAGDVPAGAPR